MYRDAASLQRIDQHSAGNRPTRRRFLQTGTALASVGLLSGCGRLPFWAQDSATRRRIGTLSVNNPVVQSWMKAWEDRLNGLGHTDGQNVTIERLIATSNDGFDELAAGLIDAKVDVIMAAGWAAMKAAKGATSTIPIVGVSSDPVGTGLVSSIQRPGGNVTGLTTLSVGLAAKRVEVFKEMIPGLRRTGVMWNSWVPDRAAEFGETRKALQALSLDLLSLEVQTAADFEPAFKRASDSSADGLILLFDQLTLPFTGSGVIDASDPTADPLATLMARYRTPAVCDVQEWAEMAGGLTTYGPDFPGLFRRAAEFVDKIMAGTKPADLPIEQPAKFLLTINLQVAKSMGLTIPTSALSLADKVVE